jgi:signal transduction histidine kinase
MAAVLAALVAALAAGGGAYLLSLNGEVDVVFGLATLFAGAALASVGALLLGLRPSNALGPLLYVAGTSLVLEYTLREYAYAGLHVRPGSLPAPEAAALVGMALDPLFFPAPIAVVLLLFPDGRLPSRRWRPFVAAAFAAAAASVVLLLLRPGPLHDDSFGHDVAWRGILPAGSADEVDAILTRLFEASLVMLVVAVVALVVRYVRADAAARQGLKPLSLVAAFIVLGLAIQGVPALVGVGQVVLVGAIAVGLPAAFAVGALRYRVWDLDRVIVAAIVYGALALLITGGYVAVVIAVAGLAGLPATPSALLPSIVATALVAVLFAPAKDTVGRAARRMVYGVRATRYDALAALPRQLAEAPAVDEVLPRTAEALTAGLGVPAARVRVMLDDGTERVAWSPPRIGGSEIGLIVMPVRHLGEPVGDVAVQPWSDRPLRDSDRHLLTDLAAQAGPALSAVALTTELRARLQQIMEQSGQLRASRQRIAAAHIDERRRLERDIHDGAQQQLVAIAMRLQGLGALIPPSQSDLRETVASCRAELSRSIDELRELARGIYPPVLSARGLVAGLQARARTSGPTVRVAASSAAEGMRLAPDIEMSVYFCCLEAIQNAAKHAPGASVVVSLDIVDGDLTFAVADDGPGFDAAAATSSGGTGLLGMADRIGAIGGAVSVRSQPGAGTTVEGAIPLGMPASV